MIFTDGRCLHRLQFGNDFKGVAGMASQKLCLIGAFVTASAIANISHGDTPPPSVADTMAYKPSQKDVEYETPKPAEFAKCKVEVERKGKVNGWIVLGPSGQTLRKFLDTDGVGGIDQWRYFNNGIEVYRDIDSNNNTRIDQCRWLNFGGTRWGIDQNEDGHIDRWKVLSAAEASREAIRAMTTGDEAALKAIMIGEDDLKSLGVNAQLVTRLLESAADPGKRAKAVMAKSKSLTLQSKWSRFDAQSPSAIPADDEKANGDLQVYESAMAIVETPGKDKQPQFHAVQIGEIIRIGEVWKLTQVPAPLEPTKDGGGITTTNGGILMEPMALAGTAASATPAGASPKVEKIIKELEDIERHMMEPAQTPAKVKVLMARRAVLLKNAIELAETDEEKMSLMKQTVDGYAFAAQAGSYPDGVDDLKAIEADLVKRSPKSPLVPYTAYRLLQAEYTVKLQAAATEENKEKQADIQKTWLENLEAFVKRYPDSDDADDAMVTLGNHEELQGRVKEAIAWYDRLLKDNPKSQAAGRAQGAKRRLSLNDQQLSLSGPGLEGGTVDVKTFKGQVVLVVFWASEYKICEEDVPQLRALYQDNKAKGFEILGVALDFDKSTALPFKKKNNMTWPQIYQPSSASQPGGLSSPIAESFGIISLPTMFLVDREGKVVNRNATITDVKTDLPNLLKAPASAALNKPPKK